MQQITLPNPKSNVPGFAKRNHLKSQAHIQQNFGQNMLIELEEEKKQTRVAIPELCKTQIRRCCRGVEDARESRPRRERERERERNAWSLTGFLSFFLSLFLLEEKAKEKLSKRKAKLS
jgi:hypothetical protein